MRFHPCRGPLYLLPSPNWVLVWASFQRLIHVHLCRNYLCNRLQQPVGIHGYRRGYNMHCSSRFLATIWLFTKCVAIYVPDILSRAILLFRHHACVFTPAANFLGNFLAVLNFQDA